jgi:hypothetical protein
MAEPRKPKSPLQRVSTRKLIASIKRDLRRIPLPKPELKSKKVKG